MTWSGPNAVEHRIEGARVVDGAEPEVAQPAPRWAAGRPASARSRGPTPSGRARSRPGRPACSPSRPRPRTSAIRRSGNRVHTPDHSQSVAATNAFTGNSVGNTSNGGSLEGSGAHRRAGVQAHDGVRSRHRRPGADPSGRCAATAGPARRGELGEAQRPEAALGVGPHHLGRQLRVEQPRDLDRDDATGVGAGPHLVVPLVPRLDARQAQRRVLRSREHRSWRTPRSATGSRPTRRCPRSSMSAMRASMSQQPRRISSKLAGSIDHSSLGRPTTAFSPTLGYMAVLVVPRLAAAVEVHHPGRPVGQRRRHPALEQVGRLDEVVVHGNQNVLAVSGCGVRQQRHSRR